MIPELEQRHSWTSEVLKVLIPGLELYGYCCGFFGRDSYETKIIESVKIISDEYDDNAHIELVVREDGHLNHAVLKDIESVVDLIESSNGSKGNSYY